MTLVSNAAAGGQSRTRAFPLWIMLWNGKHERLLRIGPIVHDPIEPLRSRPPTLPFIGRAVRRDCVCATGSGVRTRARYEAETVGGRAGAGLWPFPRDRLRLLGATSRRATGAANDRASHALVPMPRARRVLAGRDVTSLGMAASGPAS